jgi:hypothetical protein
VHELVEACRRRPGLRVRVLLDHSRAQRGGPGRNSLATLAPLLRAFPGQAEVGGGCVVVFLGGVVWCGVCGGAWGRCLGCLMIRLVGWLVN